MITAKPIIDFTFTSVKLYNDINPSTEYRVNVKSYNQFTNSINLQQVRKLFDVNY